ncbi:hypothetical protein QYM36_007617 [Artemia franciscana]|uniref:Uncharacterized protein n=1 Tax=Artemia franciscana TaxID=6661 RepID=A0AA88ICQ7_ARTSF|nr:hypothetical protein QYM36_007617 [Artemia franciscana]
MYQSKRLTADRFEKSFKVNMDNMYSMLEFMGYINKLINNSVLVLCLIAVLPGIPPYEKLTSYKLPEPFSTSGHLSRNNLLASAQNLFVGEIHGPESVVEIEDPKVNIHSIVDLLDREIRHITLGYPVAPPNFTRNYTFSWCIFTDLAHIGLFIEL